MNGMNVRVADAQVRIARHIGYHGRSGHDGSVITDSHYGVGCGRVRKYRGIWDNDWAEGIAASGTDSINQHNEPQPEKPLHSNSIVKVGVTRNPILYREPGREGKSGAAELRLNFFPSALLRSVQRRVWLPGTEGIGWVILMAGPVWRLQTNY